MQKNTLIRSLQTRYFDFSDESKGNLFARAFFSIGNSIPWVSTAIELPEE